MPWTCGFLTSKKRLSWNLTSNFGVDWVVLLWIKTQMLSSRSLFTVRMRHSRTETKRLKLRSTIWYRWHALDGTLLLRRSMEKPCIDFWIPKNKRKTLKTNFCTLQWPGLWSPATLRRKQTSTISFSNRPSHFGMLWLASWTLPSIESCS